MTARTQQQQLQSGTTSPSEAAARGRVALSKDWSSSVGGFAYGVRILCALRDLADPKDAFAWDGSWFGHPGTELIDEYAGTPQLRELIDAGHSADYITDYFLQDAQLFRETRKPFLLY